MTSLSSWSFSSAACFCASSSLTFLSSSCSSSAACFHFPECCSSRSKPHQRQLSVVVVAAVAAASRTSGSRNTSSIVQVAAPNAHPPFPISNLRPSRAKRPSSHQVAECGRREEEEEEGHGLPQHTEQRQQLAEEEGIKPPKAHTLPHDS